MRLKKDGDEMRSFLWMLVSVLELGVGVWLTCVSSGFNLIEIICCLVMDVLPSRVASCCEESLHTL